MPKLAKRKSTQEWIKDFQKQATQSGLIANAMRAGIPVEDIEVVDVTDAEYDVAENAAYLAIRTAAATEEQAEMSMGKTIATNLGLDAVKARRLMKYLNTLR